MNFYTCPVCAFPDMADAVEEGNICPCCGTEFGYDDDLGVTYQQLRNRWVQQGMRWFSRATLPPLDWDAILQLVEAGYEFERDEPATVTEFQLELVAA